MDKELLSKFLGASDYILSEMKSHRSERNCKNDREEQEPKCDDKHGHHHRKREKLSLTAKNTLRLLLEHENINQRNLAKKLNVTAQSMSEIIKKLEHAELVEKVNNKINNENIISLTEKGKSRAKVIDELLSLVTKDIFSRFTEEEKITFSMLLDKIYREGEQS